jgi:hypothetical protein
LRGQRKVLEQTRGAAVLALRGSQRLYLKNEVERRRQKIVAKYLVAKYRVDLDRAPQVEAMVML